MTTLPGAPTDPSVAIRLVTTYEDRSRRVDLAITGAESVAVEDGVATPFATDQLWLVVRDLLPPLDLLRADPRGRPAPTRRPPDASFVEDCRASVVLATVTADDVAVRTWLATDDDLWSVTPQQDGTNDVRNEARGAVGDLLVWDVTAALESLVHARRAAS